MNQENSNQQPLPHSHPNASIPPPPPISSAVPSTSAQPSKAPNEKSGVTGLSRSNPIRTISTPTGVIGKGLAVAVNKSQITSKTSSSEYGSRQKKAAVENVQNATMTTEKFVDPLSSSSTITAANNVPAKGPSIGVKIPSTDIGSATITKTQALGVKDVTSQVEGSHQSSSNNIPPQPLTHFRNQNQSELAQTPKSSNKSPLNSNNRLKITQKIGSSIAKTLSSSNTSNKNTSTTSSSDDSSVPTTQIHQQSQKSSLSIQQTTLAPKTFTLEEETDQFLAPFPLAPKPLVTNNQALPTIQNLASRRAWGDVLHFTEEYLNGATFSYQPFYSQLKNCASTFGPTTSYHHINDDRILYRLQRETSSLVAFRLQALLKLRRYSDLSREVNSLNLLTCRFAFPNEAKEEIGSKVYHFTEDLKMQDRTDTPTLPSWVSYGLSKSFYY